MAQQRVEFRLSPSVPVEQELIQALEGNHQYGAKGAFLKDRLLRGFAVMNEELDVYLAQDDPVGALELQAAKMDARYYMVMMTLLTVRMGGPRGSTTGSAGGPAVAAVAPAPAVPPVVAPQAQLAPAAAPAALPAQVQATPPHGGAERHAVEDGSPVLGEGAASGREPDGQLPPSAPVAPPKHDWGGMRGIAGVKRGA